MANVKRRVKAPKSAPKTVPKKKQTHGRAKKGLKSLQSTVEVVSTEIESNVEDPGNVDKWKADNNLLFLTPDEKVKYFLQNGHNLNDSFDVPNSVKSGRAKKLKMNASKTVSASTKSFDIAGPIKTKSGRLKNSKYKYLKLMDNILQSEFGIIPGNKHKTTPKRAVSSHNGVNNNNDTEITNQNKTTSVNNKTNHQKGKSSERIKKNTSESVSPSIVNSPQELKCNSDDTVNNEQPTLLANDTKDPKQSPVGKSKQKTSQECEQSPTKTKQASTGNGVALTALFECDYCNKIFNRKHSLVRHIYLHLGRKPHMCPVCPKTFRILKNMKVHIDRDHCVHKVDDSAEAFSCDVCDKPFLTKENLTLHLRSHVKGENMFKCIYCDKKFSYQLLLVQHEKKHLVTGKYQCTLCDMKYNSRDKLYVHIKSHLKLNDYICQYCGREFLRSNSMKRHIQTMHVGRTIQCPICNKKLKGHLTEHMRTHDKKRPHECPDCGKNFTQSTQLKVHRRGHTGSRPYMCRICERPFSHSNALMLHLRRHTGEKPFPCAECPMSFSQLPHMKAHMSKIHGKENPYKCLKCQGYFKLKKDLLVHKKTCTGTGFDSDLYGDNACADASRDEDGVYVPAESTMTLSRMRFLLALLLTMIATKEKLKYLGA